MLVCEYDVDPSTGYCRKCEEGRDEWLTATPLAVDWGVLLLISAFIMIFVGVFLLTLGSAAGLSTTGGVIFIGPFPIVFGAGPGSGLLMLIGILIVILIALYLLVSTKRGLRVPP
jgi:uncharacterized membrane protein